MTGGRTMRRGGWLAAVILTACAGGAAADWPGWRGPTGMGQTPERGLPLSWDKGGKNVLWKAPLFDDFDKIKLDQNQSSPIIRGGRVFVTVSFWPACVPQAQYPEHHVLCFRAADGKKLWDAKVKPGPWLLTDLRGGYTAPTPAADSERVYALFGSSVLAAFDFEGKPLWRKEIVPHHFDVAIGTSPVVHNGLVYVLCDQLREKKSSCLLAFDGKTSELKWRRERPDADWAHSTPVVAEVGGRTLLLTAGANALEGLDPADGKPLWRFTDAQRIGDTVSPVLAGGLVYCDSGRGGPGVAIDPGGKGDLGKNSLKWTIPAVPSGFSSPVAVEGRLYRLHGPAVLRCVDLATGKQVWAERLEGVQSATSPFATPQGHIYCASAGRSYVVRAGPKAEIIGGGDLSDGSLASPAVSEGRIVLKGRRYLWCIGNKER